MRRYIWLIITVVIFAAVAVLQVCQRAQPAEVEISEARSAPLVG